MLKNDTPEKRWPYTILLRNKLSQSESERGKNADLSIFDLSIDLPGDADLLKDSIAKILSKEPK